MPQLCHCYQNVAATILPCRFIIRSGRLLSSTVHYQAQSISGNCTKPQQLPKLLIGSLISLMAGSKLQSKLFIFPNASPSIVLKGCGQQPLVAVLLNDGCLPSRRKHLHLKGGGLYVKASWPCWRERMHRPSNHNAILPSS